VPPVVPAVVFLSGGQDHVLATQHLAAINQLGAPKPWPLTYSFGRALQDEALVAWRGRAENVAAAQRAFLHRAWCASAAALGRYRTEMETEPASAWGDNSIATGEMTWHQ
jgi:fructose-bisphosphate aldolase class I